LKLEDEPIIVSRKVLYDLRAVMCLNGWVCFIEHDTYPTPARQFAKTIATNSKSAECLYVWK
jgi:hypothetical protein